MQKLPKDLKRYLALLLPPDAFFALRSVNHAYRNDLSDFDDYFRPRVEALSAFTPEIPACRATPYETELPACRASTYEPELQAEWVSTYERIFKTIHRLRITSQDFYRAINSYWSLVKLVLQTPSLLRRFLDVEKGSALELILSLVGLYPYLHDLVIWNPELLHEFTTTKEYWFYSYLIRIYEYPRSYNSFIRNGKMISAFAYTYQGNNDHLYLCDYLEEKYNPDPRYIAAVRNTYGQDKDLIYDLLRSLKPKSSPPHASSHESNRGVVQARPEAAVTIVKRNKAMGIRPTKENRPLPPAPPQKAISPQALTQDNRLLPLVQETNTAKVLTVSTLRTQFIACSANNPLHVAVQAGEFELVQFFMNNKSLQRPNKNGDYPIHIAVTTGNVEIVKLLAADSSNLHVINKHHQTALQLAKSSRKIEIARILAEAGSHLDDENINYQTVKLEI